MSRRQLLTAGVALISLRLLSPAAVAQSWSDELTLLTIPIELTGDWRAMVRSAALKVIERMRQACFDEVSLVSDRQPSRLRVGLHPSGPPAILLRDRHSTVAIIAMNIGDRDWSKLAYQFGHELGHVTANSWQKNSKPAPPCQWLEEALVEAFSLRGLGRLAASWKQAPPFPNDHAFGEAIREYLEGTLSGHIALAREQGGIQDVGAWFARHRTEMETIPFLNAWAKALVPIILTEYERAPDCLEALGAVNRWGERSALPLADYLGAWEASCAELRASPLLPARLRALLQAE